MSTSVIRCPGCGAADTSTPGANGIHTCVYCGVRYQITQGTPTTIVTNAPAPTGGSRSLPLLLALFLLMVAGVTGMYVITKSRSEGPRPVGPSISVSDVPVSAPGDPLAAPVENKTVSVTPPAEELAPATATFTLESTRRSTNALWIYGIFQNTSPFTLGKTKVTAVFYDKDGKEIAQDSGFTEDDVIAADAKVPTTILVSDAPAAYERIEFEIHASRPSYLPTLVGGLELEADPPRKDEFMGWKFQGKVHNKGTQPARFVKVEVLAYDNDNKYAGHAFTYADAEILEPGKSARFDGTVLDSSPFSRFDFKVTGSLAN